MHFWFNQIHTEGKILWFGLFFFSIRETKVLQNNKDKTKQMQIGILEVSYKLQ